MNLSIRELEDARYHTPAVDEAIVAQMEPSASLLLQFECWDMHEEEHESYESLLLPEMKVVDGIPYLVIYKTEEKKHLNRYVVTRNHRLAPDDEMELVRMCQTVITRTDDRSIHRCLEDYRKYFPDITVTEWRSEPMHTVLQLYFCLFPGIRELLFKAGLNYLGAELDHVELYDLLPVLSGGSACDLFEKGFTHNMLKNLNSAWGIKELKDHSRRVEALETYRRYASLLGGCRITCESQWKYLKYCRRKKAGPQMRLLRMFAEDHQGTLLEDYLVLQAKLQLIRQRIPSYRGNIPSANASGLEAAMEEADYYLEYAMDKDTCDAQMEASQEALRTLDYGDDRFVVIHPHTVEDIFRESFRQKNCLCSMFRAVARGDRIVAFLRRADRPDRSFVTFEVTKGGIINQIYRAANNWLKPASEELKWIREEYMPRKGLRFSDTIERVYDPTGGMGYREFCTDYDEELPF